jgi:NADH dehydrogenase
MTVRVLLRPGSRADRLPIEAPIHVMMGSLTDDESLLAAMNGVHTIIHLAGTDARGRHADLDGVDVEGARKLVAVARIARVGRIIIVSRFGADKASAYPALRTKGQIESLVQNSGVSYTIFRTGVLFGEHDTFSEHVAMLLRAFPVYFVPGDGETMLQPLWVEDLARCVVKSLENLDMIDRVLNLGGPELVTYRRVVQRVMRASGAQRPISGVPLLWHRAGAWFLDGFWARWPFTGFWVDMLGTNRASELGNVERFFGFRPTRLDLDVLKTYMQNRRYTFELIRYILTQRW